MSGWGDAPSQRTASETRESNADGFQREHVAEIQRARLLAAMYEVACERGAANVTVAHVVGRSGVSRRTFYEIFSDREDCFLAAFDEGVDRMAAAVVPAFGRHGPWREGIRSALVALLRFLEDESLVGRLVIVEALGAGAAVLGRRRRVLEEIMAAVEGGDVKREAASPSVTAEGVVGAVLSVLHSRLISDDDGRLVELTGPLMSMIVLPYLGPAAAKRELGYPISDGPARARRPSGDPLKGLDMRLTYRTARVLMAVGQVPGASNRKLAAAAGVSDQGQISKLLTRLMMLGLVENAGRGLVRGEPNAWRLSARGREVAKAIDAGGRGG